jgi:hypothetical protein
MSEFDIPLQNKVMQNAEESALKRDNAALENAYVNDAGGISRFPCLIDFADINGDAPVTLKAYNGDLIAVTNGRTFRVDESGNSEEITSAFVNGRGRPIFAVTERDLLMAAGGDIIRYRGEKTEILSRQSPKSTHIMYKDGIVISLEPGSGRFSHTAVGVYESWNPMDVFSAEGSPDNISAAIVSDYGELMLAGTDSLELFDTSPDGDKPFYRRYITPNGIIAPYTLTKANNMVWGINNKKNFVSFSSQVGASKSDDIQVTLSNIINFEGAWASEAIISGQGFIILQVPHAINPYGTEGLTLVYDYRKKRWSNLYGWDEEKGLPSRWKGWCIEPCFGKLLVGGNGKIYELSQTSFDSVDVQRSLWRSGLIRAKGNLNKLVMHIERGFAERGDDSPVISLRVNKDNRGWGKWVRKPLGKTGQRHIILNYPSFGHAETWQFEIEMTDKGKMEISKLYGDMI